MSGAVSLNQQNACRNDIASHQKIKLASDPGNGCNSSRVSVILPLNLLQAAREGKLDPVIGRDEEIRRCGHV